MSVKVGTTISGTILDGTGNPQQRHLGPAATAGVWWLLTLNSAKDTTGVPGTHVIQSYYSDGQAIAGSVWTAGTDSPNLNAYSNSNTCSFHNGRTLGCLWINNSGTDIVHAGASLYVPGGNGVAGATPQDGICGHLRAVLTANTITWSDWGVTQSFQWNYVDTQTQAGTAIGITTDGFLCIGACSYTSELDAAVACSFEADTGATWTPGSQGGTGNTVTSSAVVTNLSTETGSKVGYGISNVNAAWLTPGPASKINSIDSGTQITGSSTSAGGLTGGPITYDNFSIGTKSTGNFIIDSSMVHQSCCYDFAALASNAMLVVYDNGADSPNNFSELNYRKSSATHAAGFWGTDVSGGDGAVFGSSSVQANNDWCLVNVDTTHIYAIRRTAATTLAARTYSAAGNTWSNLTNQPPTLSGRAFKASGGIFNASDGTNFWLFAIDSTNNVIIWSKFTVAAGTWSAWAVLESVDSTAKYLSGYDKVTFGRIGLCWIVTNGSNFDTYVSELSTVVPDEDEGIRYLPRWYW